MHVLSHMYVLPNVERIFSAKSFSLQGWAINLAQGPL